MTVLDIRYAEQAAQAQHTQAQPAAALRCKQCGTRTVLPRMRSGRTRPYRNMQALPIPDDFPIPTCSRCHTEIFDEQTRAKLAPILADAYRETLRRLILRAINTLMQHTSQRRLEMLLGLSQGYLSRLRAGAGTPSPELVSNLAMLAKAPKSRLAELERYWADPLQEIDASTRIGAAAEETK